MDVIDMLSKIIIISDGVFPKARLPDRRQPFALLPCGRWWNKSTGFSVRPRKRLFYLTNTGGEIRIAIRQRNDKMKMIGQ